MTIFSRRKWSEQQDAAYRDLLERLTKKAWLAFAFVVSLIIFTYVMGLWQRPTIFFLAVEAPMMAAAWFILSVNHRLALIALFTWTATALAVIGYFSPTDVISQGVVVELLPLAMLSLFIYWLVRAIAGNRAELRGSHEFVSLPKIVAIILTLWGATLQVALIVITPARYLLADAAGHSYVGELLLGLLRFIRLGSPVSWIPIGFLLLGLFLFAMIRFSDDPYVASDYSNVLPVSSEVPFVNEIVAGIRLPVWLVVVILGFVKHFVRLTWESLRDFLRTWLGRLVLILVGLVVPVLAFASGHAAVYLALSRVGRHLDLETATYFSGLTTVIIVHLLFIAGLALFVVGVGPMALPIEGNSIDGAMESVREHLRSEGFSAAQAVGKAFVLFGLVIIAVPIAALLPGGAGWGSFATCYTLVLTLFVVSYAVWDRLPEEEKQTRLGFLANLIKNVDSASEVERGIEDHRR